MADDQTPKPAPAPKPAAPATPAAPAAAPAAVPAAPKPAVVPAPPRPKTETEDVKALLGRFSPSITHLEDLDPRIPFVLLGDPQLLTDLAQFLMADRKFEHLALITGVDYKTHLECVYNFFSYSKNTPLAVKVRLPTVDAKLPSLTGLWATADWHERETYDLMGITFVGHPNLRRILLPEGWQGHPLRKDYAWKKEQYVGLDPETGEDVVYQEPREGAW